MKRLRYWGSAIVVGAAVGATVSVVAFADNKDNDRVLRGDRMEFIEVFRQDDKNGDKNYQYTITEFTDKFGRVCTVATVNSEQAVGLDCDWKEQG